MKIKSFISLWFWISALYDGVLGLFFLFAAEAVYKWFNVIPPNHFGYVQFPAALLIIFGLMFAAVARNPIANRNLIPYGILLKCSYCGVAFYHWWNTGIPNMWKPFAIADLVFLAVFIWAYLFLTKAAKLETKAFTASS